MLLSPISATRQVTQLSPLDETAGPRSERIETLEFAMQMLEQLFQQVLLSFILDRLDDSPSAAPRPSEAPPVTPAFAAPPPAWAPPAAPPDAPAYTQTPADAAPPVDAPRGARATSLDALDRSFDPGDLTFVPIRSPEEARRRDAQIHDEHDFAAAVDEAAARYGIPPELLRAQVQTESWGFGNSSNPDQYLEAMRHRGDLDRGDNASRGLLQISGNFLDGGEWSAGGPNNPRVGGRSVSREDYDNSITLQLDVGAANLAQRIADGGGLREGLAYYFSGSFDPSRATGYLEKIDAGLRDEYAQGL
ncbi:MAG TPA: FmdB family transcriptional regulator [Methylibium sp.]|uniref:FmdB family transcriptional regulator n=1 Tax=Methylibium sp. TaxID=2067992 RepID=UPI002DBBD89B|nr:FmdB family transcriptional regulator [Methylibium sp.]HEU4458853.1 FmdB family transcriptional regulator [Methylibium sp.]